LNKKTSYTDPRLAYAKSTSKQVDDQSSSSKGNSMADNHSTINFYDDNSTAIQLIKSRDLTGYNAIVVGANRGVGKLLYSF
jgi:hypothetical protein